MNGMGIMGLMGSKRMKKNAALVPQGRCEKPA